MNIELTSPAAQARSEALNALRDIGRTGNIVALEPDDVMEALGQDLPLLTINGLYYKTLATLTRFIRPLGVVLVLLVGIVALIRIVTKAPAYIINKLRTAANVVATVVSRTTGLAPFGLLFSLFGIGKANDGEPTDPEEIAELMKNLLPGPAGSAFGIIDAALASIGGPSQVSSVIDVPSTSGPLASNPFAGNGSMALTLSPTSTPVASVAPAQPEKVPLWETAVNGVLKTGIVDSIFSGIGSIFSDGEAFARDEHAQKLAALAVAAGVPPQTIRAILAKDSQYTSSF